MFPEAGGIAERARRLAEFLVANDLESLRIERENEVFEVGRTPEHVPPVVREQKPVPAPARIEQIAADRVGIFHVSRPVPFAGELLEGDRELGYVEQLGIRNPIRSRGPGRILAVLQQDGDLVDYGRPLFEVER